MYRSAGPPVVYVATGSPVTGERDPREAKSQEYTEEAIGGKPSGKLGDIGDEYTGSGEGNSRIAKIDESADHRGLRG